MYTVKLNNLVSHCQTLDELNKRVNRVTEILNSVGKSLGDEFVLTILEDDKILNCTKESITKETKGENYV